MKNKKIMVAVLACLLMALSVPTVCFAMGSESEDPALTCSGDPAVTEQDEEEDSVSSDGIGDEITGTVPDGGEMPEGGETMSSDGTVEIPYGSMEAWKEAITEEIADSEEEPVIMGRVNVEDGTYLNLRSGSGMDQDVIGHLFPGDKLEITGEDGDWYQVTVRERSGYVHKDYVDVMEQAASGDTTDKEMLEMLLYLMMSGQQGGAANQSSAALTPDGNLTLVDDYTQTNPDGSGKQFITVTTKDGNYFYLVIDRDEDGDENVHFMNLVDEADLLALMDEEEAGKYTEPTQTEPTEPEPSESEEPQEAEPEEEEPEKKSGGNALPAVILLAALLGGGGIFLFKKMKGKQKQQAQEKPDPDADYVEGEEEEELDLPDDVGDFGDDEPMDESAFAVETDGNVPDEADENEDNEEDESTMFDADDNEPV